MLLLHEAEHAHVSALWAWLCDTSGQYLFLVSVTGMDNSASSFF